MIKHCPITSGRGNTYSQRICEEEKCAFWDEEKKQCCIKSAALAIAGNTGGNVPLSHVTYEQAQYIPPTAIPNSNINSPYVTFSITP